MRISSISFTFLGERKDFAKYDPFLVEIQPVSGGGGGYKHSGVPTLFCSHGVNAFPIELEGVLKLGKEKGKATIRSGRFVDCSRKRSRYMLAIVCSPPFCQPPLSAVLRTNLKLRAFRTGEGFFFGHSGLHGTF